MKISRFVMISFSALYFAGNQAASAADEQRLNAVEASLTETETNVERLPPAQEEAVSGSTQNVASLGRVFPDIRGLLAAARPLPTPRGSFAPGTVSSPFLDKRFSQFAGFSQSESSIAWCGGNAVVAYTDSGSFLETLLETQGGLSLVGVSHSTDLATAVTPTFIDKRFLDPGTDTGDQLAGDPVAICTDANTFYIASLFFRSTANTSDISVSKTTNGGASFPNPPVSAVSAPSATHLLDKPWLDGVTGNLYVTYTDFDSSDETGFCQGQFRTAIELVRSTNGGTTWSAPTVVAEACGLDLVHGSQVAVAPGGVPLGSKVYVAWELTRADNTRAQFVTSLTNLVPNFPSPVEVAAVNCVGSCGGLFDGDPGLLRGNFRSAREFPSLAVSPSNASAVYLTWHDARVYKQDAFSVNGYGFADILFSKSADGGATWSAPVRVNNNAEPADLESDQYQPAIAAQTNNKLAICYYDRRLSDGITAINSAFERYCAVSTNAGATWNNVKRSAGPFAPTPGQDLLLNPLFFGDYDNVTTEGTGANTTNFAGAWSETKHGNPDIRALRF